MTRTKQSVAGLCFAHSKWQNRGSSDHSGVFKVFVCIRTGGTMDQQTQPVYEFLGFQLDVGQRVLIRDGNLIALTPKAFDVLLFLIQNRGRVVEKDELMKAIWPESFVEEGNLSQNIFILRKILDDQQNGGSVIHTIPGRGYKFVASVKQLDIRAITSNAKGSADSFLSAE
jgi:DNA-binding winged helix-turn-helix (wHTH) protein